MSRAGLELLASTRVSLSGPNIQEMASQLCKFMTYIICVLSLLNSSFAQRDINFLWGFPPSSKLTFDSIYMFFV